MVDMPWHGSTWFTFEIPTILSSAPAESGVYALRSVDPWIYIGESSNIQATLLRHHRGENLGIQGEQPARLAFEVVPDASRHARQGDLIREFRPACNQWDP